MLPSRRRDVYDSGQSLHARLRILLVPKGNPRIHDMRLDPAEPLNVARMAADMNLRYVVITSVNRDDLATALSPFCRDRSRGPARAAKRSRGSADAGFRWQHASRGARPRCRAARFQSQYGDRAAPLSPCAPQADYRQSLEVLRFARQHRPGVMTKSGFMAAWARRPPRWSSCCAICASKTWM